MAVSKQKFREIVLQLLFSADFAATSSEEMLPFMMKQFAISRSGIREAQANVASVLCHLCQIDDQIRATATEYRLERIPLLEKAILRLGIYELLHTDLPPKVVIAEGLRLARKYATDEAVSFVNAILDKIHKTKCTCNLQPESS
jgi:N utilization substance protein B